MRKPCAECPFSRQVKPGTTGGADPSVYVGQAMGPFLLPCHMDPNYEANRRSPELLQCAGAAAFRANIGVSKRMPAFLLSAEPDRERVFATPAELLAHHGETSLETAEDFLRRHPPTELLRIELRKSGVQEVAVPRLNVDPDQAASPFSDD